MSSFNKHRYHKSSNQGLIQPVTHDQVDEAIQAFLAEGGAIKRIDAQNPHSESELLKVNQSQSSLTQAWHLAEHK